MGDVAAVASEAPGRDAVERARARVHANSHAAWVVEASAEPPRSGPLAGMPFGVKDIIDVAGLPTRCGSPLTATTPAVRDAPVVASLRDAGAAVVGKTVTTEFAYFSPGPTRNPHDPRHTPGGSSSGSAAAVAAGDVPFALGSQTAGSLTRPAAYCGVLGLVLRHGALDLGGIAGLSTSLDRAGVLAADVATLERVLDVLLPTGPYAAARRVLVWDGAVLADVEPAMADAVASTAERARAAGLAVASADLGDHLRTLAADHSTVMAYEVAREHPELVSLRARVSAQLAGLIDRGLAVTDTEYADALYRRDRSRIELDRLLGDDTILLGPAAQGPAPEGLAATGSPVMSLPWQLLGHPQLTVPAGDVDGLPLGVQLVGRDERALLATARRLGADVHRTPSTGEDPDVP